MSDAGRILRVEPAAAIPGGEVVIECADFDTSLLGSCRASFDDQHAWLVGASPRRVLAIVPELDEGGEVSVSLESADEYRTAPERLVVGRKLAEHLHQVANPAFDPRDGSLYLTRSGSRGKRLPVSLFRLDASGELLALHGEITNPTAIAFNAAGELFVTSRLDGVVYRVTPFQEIVPFASNLGVATGMAFDREGNLYVGDRSGSDGMGIIYRISPFGQTEEWAYLEPSVAAYHLAFGADDALYVTAPTVASFDPVMRIDPRSKRSEVFYASLGRPQGLAFDREGYLYVAASFQARRGIVRISPDGTEARLVVAGMNVVGLAFSATGDMIVATNDTIYSLPLGIRGTLLPVDGRQ